MIQPFFHSVVNNWRRSTTEVLTLTQDYTHAPGGGGKSAQKYITFKAWNDTVSPRQPLKCGSDTYKIALHLYFQGRARPFGCKSRHRYSNMHTVPSVPAGMGRAFSLAAGGEGGGDRRLGNDSLSVVGRGFSIQFAPAECSSVISREAWHRAHGYGSALLRKDR